MFRTTDILFLYSLAFHFKNKMPICFINIVTYKAKEIKLTAQTDWNFEVFQF